MTLNCTIKNKITNFIKHHYYVELGYYLQIKSYNKI